MADGEQGRLVAADRPGELARAIRVLLDYPDRMAAMGAAGRAQVAERFTWERSTERLRQLYDAISPKTDWIPPVGSGTRAIA